MTIASSQFNPWSDPWAASATSPRFATEASWSATQVNWGSAAQEGPWSGPNGPVTNGAANPLQNLAADIQAMLIQTQTAPVAATGGTGAPAPAAGGATSGNTLSPVQKLAADIQTLLSDLQAAATPNPQTANANPAASPDQAGHHHHHHHHHRNEGGGEANGATAVAGSAGTTNSAAGADQALSRAFAADIAQALQVFAGSNASSAAQG